MGSIQENRTVALPGSRRPSCNHIPKLLDSMTYRRAGFVLFSPAIETTSRLDSFDNILQ